ncbi:Gfo/Idh/MocA family oxidoreductase [Micromonospora sp. DR5-3]|uniref:Gfo/Idh/MocA family protein n=1 Tax=unclassified Micromonospora TaxID=2617518 RepID=UPI0011D4F819|nr:MULTISPECIES: Gfo/Idh/MocA family oxidoreductase [unclassified Micromonospora]MCW3819232.1 Gfo/Idh/MocA family oxidoreductase [Micromonospora sp. DR5-3]TYC20987.1 Gfo/Idh/MocA family oxidoreductase [Micromonospora sp. MP36]
MRIALAGLATSHPYTDAKALCRHADLVVWEPDPQRLARFRAEHPDATVTPDLSALLATRPDGVVLTVPTSEVPEALARVLDAGLPCFVNKPAAATVDQLDRLDRVVSRSPELVLSSSVLRFAPDFAAFAVPREEVLAVRATVRHDVGLWATGYNPWQDDPAVGGGTLVMMGLHGVELLVALLGPAVRLVGAAATTRSYRTLRSEDTGLLAVQWDDGVPGVVEVLGVSQGESYEVTVHTATGEHRVNLRGGADELGYGATIDAFLGMVKGAPSPVPWAQTRSVLGVLAAARAQL